MADGYVTISTKLDAQDIIDSVKNINKVFDGLSGIVRVLSGDLTGLNSVLDLQSVILELAASAMAELINAFTQAIDSAAAFEQGLAKASTLFRDVQVNVDILTDSLLELSTATGREQTELLEGLYKTLSASIPVTEDMAVSTGFLTTATKLSIAGFAEETKAVETLAKIINAYNLDVAEANRIAGVLIETQNKGITTVGELGTYFAQAAVSAAEVGVEIEQVAASVALLTANGVRARMASTYTRQLILELDKSSSKGAQALRDAALAADLGEMSFRDFIAAGWTLGDVIQLISQYTRTMGINMSEAFSSSSALQAAQALADGAERYAENLDLMRNSLNALDTAYEKVTDTFQMSMQRIHRSQEAIMTAWGLSWLNLASTTATGVEKAMDEAAKAAASSDVISVIDGIVDSWSAAIDGFFQGLGHVIERIPTYVAVAFEGILQLAYNLIKNIGYALGNMLISVVPNLIINAVASLIDMLASVLDVNLFGWKPLEGLTDSMHDVAQTVRESYVPTIQEMQAANKTLAETADEAATAIKGLSGLTIKTAGDTTVVIPWDDINQNLLDYKDAIDSTDEAEMKFIAKMALLDRQQAAWGDRLDVTSQKLSLIKSRLVEVLEAGADPDSTKVRKLLDLYDSLAETGDELQDIQKIYDTYNAKVAQNLTYYYALDDSLGLYNAQVNAAQSALSDLIRLGVKPSDEGFKAILSDLHLFNNALSSLEKTSKADEIFDTLNSQLQYAANYFETFGDEAEATAIKTRAYASAIEALTKLDYDAYKNQIEDLKIQWQSLTKENDAATDILSELTNKLVLINAKEAVFGDTVSATEEKVSAYASAIESLLKLGLEPTDDIIKILRADMLLYENSLVSSTSAIDEALATYQTNLDNITVKQQVYGSSYNYIRAQINAVEAAINSLIANGLTAEDDALKKLIETWDTLTKAQAKSNMAMTAFKAGATSLISGLEDAFTVLAEGEESWNAFAKAGLTAIAAVLESFAKQLAIQSIAAWPNFGQMALAATGAVAAAAAAALVKNWAGSFATGGVVKGPYNGYDNLTASVKAGEVILNHAQAINTARLLEAMEQGGQGGYVAINFNGVVLGTKKEISKYVYDGIKESQIQGVLKKW